MQNILTQDQYENGLAEFIANTTAALADRGRKKISTVVKNAILKWHDLEPQSQSKSIKPYLEFANNTTDITLKNPELKDFHAAFFDLATHYAEEQKNKNITPNKKPTNSSKTALTAILPQWLDNFANNFNASERNFKLKALNQ